MRYESTNSKVCFRLSRPHSSTWPLKSVVAVNHILGLLSRSRYRSPRSHISLLHSTNLALNSSRCSAWNFYLVSKKHKWTVNMSQQRSVASIDWLNRSIETSLSCPLCSFISARRWLVDLSSNTTIIFLPMLLIHPADRCKSYIHRLVIFLP